MQMYERRNDESYRTTPKCGYCREEGHNQYQCSKVAEDWAYWDNYQVPPVQRKRYYWTRNNPKYWGEWYEKCRDLTLEQARRKNKPKTPRTRAKSKCGFCREAGHSRRDCHHMEDFLQKCYKANENWRRAAYKELVEKHGICVGAAVEVKMKDGWSSTATIKSEVALITKVNFDSLNVMAAKSGYYNGSTNPYECSLEVHALIDGQERQIKIHTDDDSYSDTWQKDFARLNHKVIAKASGGYYQSWHLNKTLSRSEHPLDEKWVTDYKGAFELLLKKRTKEQLDSDDITSLIDRWSKKV